jgi:pimeloyl-ACP methyl ester carboxylesterase
MDQNNNAEKLKRRDFLALGAAGVAGVALAGGSPLAHAAETSGLPPTFRMFPGNYTWSAAVRGVISNFPNGGGDMGEIYKVCAALQGKAGDNAAWFAAWNKMGEHVAQLADEAKAKGYTQTASGACLRAAHYIQVGELVRQPRTPETQKAYAHSVELFKKGIPDVPFLSVEAVEVPFEGGKSLPAYFVKRSDVKDHKWPTVVFFAGLDSTKEILYFRGGPDLAKRGVACLVIDAPGNGEAIRFRGMPARYDSEVAGSAAIDYLQKRPDVDKNRIGVVGVSLGGYFAPRAAAFDKRFKTCVAWGAQWDYYAVWKERVDKAFKSSLSVPGEHILWFLGVDNMDQALEKLKPFTLEGVAQKVECPFLLTHGEKDAQISMESARKEFAAVGSKDKTLKIFTEEEGGSEHCQGDNLTLGITYIGDWLAEKLVKA